MAFQLSEFIASPPGEVFDVITDIEQCPDWIPGIVRIEPLTNQPFGKGYKWKETRQFKMLGFIPVRASSTLEVTEYNKRSRTYTTTFDDGCNFVAYAFKVKKEGDGSRVTLDTDCKGTGKYEGNAKVADKLERMMQKYDGDLLVRIKSYIEG